MKKLFCMSLVLFMVSFAAPGQITPKIHHYTKTTYEAQNQNWSADQLPNAFMIFGNSEGLLIHNGTDWNIHKSEVTSIIRIVQSDKNGNIYVGGFEEFGVWEKDETGRLSYRSICNRNTHDFIKNHEIWNIVILGGVVYFQSFQNIFKYSLIDESIKDISLPRNNGIMFLQEVSGRLYFQALGNKLFEIRSDDTIRPIPGTESFKDRKVVFMVPYKYYGILIGTEKSGMFILTMEGIVPWDNEVSQELRMFNLNKGLLLSNGSFALGTTLNGLYIVEPSGKLSDHLNKQTGLQNNTILSMVEDVKGNLWLGLDSGIDLIELNSELKYFTDYSGRIGTVYTAMLHENYLYLGTNQGLFVKPWHHPNVSTEHNEFELISGSEGQIWNLKEENGILYCSHNDFVFSVHKKNIEKVYNAPSWDFVKSPFDSSVFYVGTYTGVAVVNQKASGQWEETQVMNKLGGAARKLLFDDRNQLWTLNPYRGISKIDVLPNNGSLGEFKVYTKEDGLASEFNLDMTKIGEDIFIKSQSNFYMVDTKSSSLIKIDTINSYPIFDEEFKIASGVGLEWFQIFKEKVRYFSPYDTLDFNIALVPPHEKILPLSADHYLFCLDNGYALFDKMQTLRTKSANGGAPLIHQIDNSGLTNTTRFCDFRMNGSIPDMEFLPSNNNIKIHFTSTEYTVPNRYQYKLKGQSNNWSEWTKVSSKEYTNLPAGKYTFYLRSKLDAGITTFKFKIQPYWYETTLAHFGFVVIFLCLLYLLRYVHRVRLASERKKLNLQNERKLHEQQLKNENHQLHKEISRKHGELANVAMTLVKKNELLLQIKNQFEAIKNELGDRFPKKHLRQIRSTIDSNLTNESDWKLFETNFNMVHEDFFKKMKSDFPDLSNSDLKLAAYIKSNLSTKQIAQLLSITTRSLENKRYMLRKRMNLNRSINLTEYIIVNY